MGILIGALGLIAALTVAISAGRQLARARTECETAWQDIAQIQDARVASASAALDALGNENIAATAALRTRARDALARAKITRDAEVLHNPAAINAWKQSQGELTGALFMLAMGNAGGVPAPAALEQLRLQLVQEEEALAQARNRYSQASAAYANATQPVAGAMVAALLRYPELPATL